MNWEHTHLALAPRAGRVDQLRDEATSYRQSRDLLKDRRSRRSAALRDRLVEGFAALTNMKGRHRRLQEPRPRQAELHMSARKNEMEPT